MKKYLVALDQGTTSSRAIVFDRSQQIVASAQKEFPQLYPQAGWVEHDPLELYSSQYGVMMEAITRGGIDPAEIAAIGITNQRETTILWDRKTGKPVCNAIVWQCRRTAEEIERLKAEGAEPMIREKTGLVPDAYFSATKIRWILDHVPGAQERAERGELLFGTVDSWLIWKLTRGRVHATDVTNASRTMLFDIRRLDWDETLLQVLRIPRCMLPDVRPSSGDFGTCNIQGVEIPIAGAAGDQQAALFGQCCFAPGEAKNTYGTGCFLLMNTGETPCVSRHGLVTTIAAGLGGHVTYALEGSVFVGGAVIQWLRDEVGLIKDAAESGPLAETVPDNGGVYLVSAFTGLGAPHWDMYARGTMVGLTRGTTRAHIVRAALEGIAYQVKDLLDAMELDSGRRLSSLKVDGGASVSDFLMQFQADILRRPIDRPRMVETTAFGAAFLAGLAAGLWTELSEITELRQSERVFEPLMDAGTASRYHGEWFRAVECAKKWEATK